MKKDITPKDKKGQRHGYWERYRPNGQLFFKGEYVNGSHIGLWEIFWEIYGENSNHEKLYYLR